jgi:hypothetical protein
MTCSLTWRGGGVPPVADWAAGAGGRNTTLTALPGRSRWWGSKLPAALQLQFFLPESVWELKAVSARRLELLRADPRPCRMATAVPVIDDGGTARTGKTTHVGR